MNIRKAPYRIDFAGNHPCFEIQTNRTDCNNYRVMAWFDFGETRTPDMWLEYSEGVVRIDAGILRSLFPKPSLPLHNLSYRNFLVCQNNMVPVRLYFSEIKVGQPETARTLLNTRISQLVWLVNGNLPQYCRDNNIPDWRVSDPRHFYLKTDIDIFSQDNGETVYTDFSVEQYLHVCNFTHSDISSTPVVTIRKTDGTVETLNTEDLLFPRESISSIPASLAAFSCQNTDEVVSYTISFSNSSISRTFVKKDFHYGFHTFLLLNSMNLYESFIVENLEKEEQTTGERRIRGETDSYVTTDRQTVLTAKCHPHSHTSYKILHAAFSRQYNLLLDGDHAWYIDMIPGSLIVSDESSDLIEAKFQFRLRERINRNPQTISSINEDEETGQIIRTDTIFR